MRKPACFGVCLFLVSLVGGARAESTATAVPASAPAASAPSVGVTEQDQNTPPEANLVAPKPRQGYFLALGLHAASAMAFDQNQSTRNPNFGEGI